MGQQRVPLPVDALPLQARYRSSACPRLATRHATLLIVRSICFVDSLQRIHGVRFASISMTTIGSRGRWCCLANRLLVVGIDLLAIIPIHSSNVSRAYEVVIVPLSASAESLHDLRRLAVPIASVTAHHCPSAG
jgi:hypothetical protein